MRQRGLAPARVEESDPEVLVGHVRGRRFDLAAIILSSFQGFHLASRCQEIMHLSHEPSMDREGRIVAVDF